MNIVGLLILVLNGSVCMASEQRQNKGDGVNQVDYTGTFLSRLPLPELLNPVFKSEQKNVAKRSFDYDMTMILLTCAVSGDKIDRVNFNRLIMNSFAKYLFLRVFRKALYWARENPDTSSRCILRQRPLRSLIVKDSKSVQDAFSMLTVLFIIARLLKVRYSRFLSSIALITIVNFDHLSIMDPRILPLMVTALGVLEELF